MSSVVDPRNAPARVPHGLKSWIRPGIASVGIHFYQIFNIDLLAKPVLNKMNSMYFKKHQTGFKEFLIFKPLISTDVFAEKEKNPTFSWRIQDFPEKGHQL